jgi:hypothetical protein
MMSGRWWRAARVCGRGGSLCPAYLGVWAAVALRAGGAQAQTAPPGPASVAVRVPADTILRPPDERVPIEVRARTGTRIAVTIAAAATPDVVIWRSDTVVTGPELSLRWGLSGRDGRAVPSGRYALSVQAVDSGGARSGAALEIVRLPADTVPLPRPPRASELLPETVQVRQTSPWAILIGAAAGLLPQLAGRGELNDGRRGDPRTWIVVGSVTAVGFAAIVAGHRAAYSAENAATNAQLEAEYHRRLEAADADNERARASPRYWVHSPTAGR